MSFVLVRVFCIGAACVACQGSGDRRAGTEARRDRAPEQSDAPCLVLSDARRGPHRFEQLLRPMAERHDANYGRQAIREQ